MVDDDLTVATNKHVVKPWLFRPEIVKLRDEGWSVDENRVQVFAWPSGVDFLTPRGVPDLTTGYSTVRRTLRPGPTTPDVFHTVRRRLPAGGTYEGSFHRNGPDDLALLRIQARPRGALRPFVLRGPDDPPVRKVAPVMVLGYPGGLNRSARAETAPATGEVRKVGGPDDPMLYVSAPIVPGNSGGPVLAPDGRVLGISTESYGDATLGGCVPARFVRALLSKR